jgi:hypothetical protein
MTDTERQFKRFFIAGGYGLVLIICVAVLVFVFAPAENPFPGPQGPDTEPLQVKRTKMLSLSEDTRDLVAEVKNPNDRYGIRKLTYAFVLENGEETRKVRGKSYILPGETRFFTELNISVDSSYSLRTFEIETQDTWKQLEVNPPTLVVQNQRQGQNKDNNRYGVRGEIVNRSPYDLDTVTVTIALEGKDGNIVGVNNTQMSILQNDETREFQVQWPSSVSFSNIERTRIRPSANALDPDTVLYITEENEDQFR